MAYIFVKRIYQDEIIPVMSKRTTRAEANAKVAEIATFPERMSNEADGIQGEIWIEVEEENGNLLGDPVVFPPQHARTVLLRTGASVEMVDRALADETCEEYLHGQRAAMLARFGS